MIIMSQFTRIDADGNIEILEKREQSQDGLDWRKAGPTEQKRFINKVRAKTLDYDKIMKFAKSYENQLQNILTIFRAWYAKIRNDKEIPIIHKDHVKKLLVSVQNLKRAFPDYNFMSMAILKKDMAKAEGLSNYS